MNWHALLSLHIPCSVNKSYTYIHTYVETDKAVKDVWKKETHTHTENGMLMNYSISEQMQWLQ